MKKLTVLLLTLTHILDLCAQTDSISSYLQNKQFEKVVALIPSLSAADSSDINISTAVAQAWEGMMDYRNAYKWYKLNKPDTERIEYYLSLGKAASFLGRNNEASDYFSQALKLDSANYYARYQLAQIARSNEDMQEAIDLFERLSSAYPENISLHTTLADCYLKINDASRAAYSLLAAHKLNRENPDIAANLSNLILSIGAKPRDAIIVCDTTLSYTPENRKLLLSKAMAYYTNKDYEEADTIFRKLLMMNDSSFVNLKYAGASRLGIQHYQSADSVLSVAFDSNPEDIENALLYARALSGSQKTDAALNILDYTDTLLMPRKAFVYEVLKTRGDCARQVKKYEEALKYYYDAYQVLPDRKAILMNIGSFCQQLPRDKSLYILKEIIETSKAQKQSLKPIGAMYWILLKKYQKELFFENAKTVNIRSPYGKTSQIPLEEIETMIEAFKPEERQRK
ncbi:MAG: tetratricopeptide repeat protein [Bacteroidales bacterium]